MTASSPTRFADMPDVHRFTAVALERAGFTTAFPVQEAVLPVAAQGRDVLVKSPTGSGKTLAFGLSIIAQVERGERTPKAVVLVPGRELAIQIRDELVPIAWSRQQRCVAIYGGGTGQKHAKLGAESPILVATPGRLLDLVRQGSISLRQAEILVLDEADRMLDMGFTSQVEAIAAAMPKRRQTMLFSATLEGRVGAVAEKLTHDPVRLELDVVPGEAGEIEHQLVSVRANAKLDALVDLLADPDRGHAVIFVRTQKGAANLCEALRATGHRATTVHGGMSQPERLREHAAFQRGQCDVLVATDVYARGMDVDQITHVVNYELPEDADAYRHRIGRTGRAGRSGTAITLVPNEKRRVVEALLLDLGLPLDLLEQMRPGATERAKVVPEAERYVDPEDSRVRRGRGDGERDRDQERRERERGPRDRARRTPEFAQRGNGRGKPLTKTAPPRGAAGTGSGRGTISDYDPKRGFGFIKQAAGGKDVFFHRRAVRGADDRSLRSGMQVSFSLDPAGDGKKLRAKQVTLA